MNKQIAVSLLLAGAAIAAPLGAAPASAQATNSIILQVDRPTASEQLDALGSFGGWAIDQNIANGPGIPKVDIYVDGDATTGHFLGSAALGGVRPDVAAQFGNPAFTTSGWNFNLANVAIAGQHSFTFIATAANGAVAAKNVSSVTLVPPAPVTFLTSQPFQTLSTYSATQYNTGQYLPTGFSTPQYTAPQYLVPQTTFLSPSYTPATYEIPQSTSFLAPPALPYTTVPAVIAPIPASLSVAPSMTATMAGGSMIVNGTTTVVPYNGSLAYTLTDQFGKVVASGSLSVFGAPGQSGTFSGTVTYPPGVLGPATLTLTETDQGRVIATATSSVSFVNYTTPLLPGQPGYPYWR